LAAAGEPVSDEPVVRGLSEEVSNAVEFLLYQHGLPIDAVGRDADGLGSADRELEWILETGATHHILAHEWAAENVRPLFRGSADWRKDGVSEWTVARGDLYGTASWLRSCIR
jgi:hypothetical protein